MSEGKEMTALEYLNEVVKMGNKYDGNCNYCPLGSKNNGFKETCINLQQNRPEEAIAIVRKWADENQVATIKDKL